MAVKELVKYGVGGNEWIDLAEGGACGGQLWM